MYRLHSPLRATAVGVRKRNGSLDVTWGSRHRLRTRMSVPSPYKEDINVINVLVMIETAPQSDAYFQMQLTEAQHNKLLRLLDKFNKQIDIDTYEITTTDDEPVVIPNRQQYCLDKRMDNDV